MIDEEKIYTKKEFEELMNNYFPHIIKYYELKSGAKRYDYYTVPGYPLTRRQINSDKYGYFYPIKYKEIGPISVIADAVSMRSDKKVPTKFINNMKKHDIKDNPVSFYHGYMQGISAVVRYLSNHPEDLGCKRTDLWDGLFLNYIDEK